MSTFCDVFLDCFGEIKFNTDTLLCDYIVSSSPISYSDFNSYFNIFRRSAKKFLKRVKNKCNLELLFLRKIGFPVDKPCFHFTLMNSQHIIAKLNGYSNWNQLLGLSKELFATIHSGGMEK